MAFLLNLVIDNLPFLFRLLGWEQQAYVLNPRSLVLCVVTSLFCDLGKAVSLP